MLSHIGCSGGMGGSGWRAGMGGGFGGKESQASPYAADAARGAWVTGRPCRCWLHREWDPCSVL